MIWEISPAWRWAKMTKSQVKAYIKELEKKRELARKKLEQAKASWEFDSEEKELQELEDLLS